VRPCPGKLVRRARHHSFPHSIPPNTNPFPSQSTSTSATPHFIPLIGSFANTSTTAPTSNMPRAAPRSKDAVLGERQKILEAGFRLVAARIQDPALDAILEELPPLEMVECPVPECNRSYFGSNHMRRHVFDLEKLKDPSHMAQAAILRSTTCDCGETFTKRDSYTKHTKVCCMA